MVQVVIFASAVQCNMFLLKLMFVSCFVEVVVCEVQVVWDGSMFLLVSICLIMYK